MSQNVKIFTNKIFTKDDIADIDFSETEFINCEFKELNLKNRQFQNCKFKDCEFSKNNFDNSGFSETLFKKCNFKTINFKNATFNNVTFCDKCVFCGVNFKNVKSFKETKIKDSKFEDISLGEIESIGLMKNGLTFSLCNFKNQNDKRELTYRIFMNEELKDNRIIATTHKFIAPKKKKEQTEEELTNSKLGQINEKNFENDDQANQNLKEIQGVTKKTDYMNIPEINVANDQAKKLNFEKITNSDIFDTENPEETLELLIQKKEQELKLLIKEEQEEKESNFNKAPVDSCHNMKTLNKTLKSLIQEKNLNSPPKTAFGFTLTFEEMRDKSGRII
jgi:uncharacterized protein YjbI with pentapeptide repeats